MDRLGSGHFVDFDTSPLDTPAKDDEDDKGDKDESSKEAAEEEKRKGQPHGAGKSEATTGITARLMSPYNLFMDVQIESEMLLQCGSSGSSRAGRSGSGEGAARGAGAHSPLPVVEIVIVFLGAVEVR